MTAPLVAIELFPCSGGMAEGFRRAGITFAMAFDKDADACASYEANLGHRPVQMDVRDLLRMARAGWRPAAPIDLLVADPPCTPWSRAGKRQGIEDERDMLVETCALIEVLRPRAYLIGNVPGLNDAPSWKHVQRYIGGLRHHGYCVADYAELDAAAYGVAQHRVRPFWFGHLEGPCLRWPAPTHGQSAGPALPGLALAPFVTCREALSQLPPEQLGRPVRLRMRPTSGKDGGDRSRISEADAPAKTVMAKASRKGGQILATEGHPLADPDRPAPTVRSGGDGHSAPQVVLNLKHPPSHADAPARTVAARDRCQGNVLVDRVLDPNRPPTGPDEVHRTVSTARDQALLEWPWDRPSTTIARDDRIPPPGHHAGNSYMSSPNAIVLSEKAAAILQGFPPGWVFSGKTKRARWSQLGQAMPPPLAAAVAGAIVEQLASAAFRAVAG